MDTVVMTSLTYKLFGGRSPEHMLLNNVQLNKSKNFTEQKVSWTSNYWKSYYWTTKPLNNLSIEQPSFEQEQYNKIARTTEQMHL